MGKNEPVCIADEVPFDIPESWEWVRLGSITSVLGGKRIPAGRKLTQENTGHPYIRISDMKDDRVLIDSIQFVPEDVFPGISKYIINKEDVFITVAGTIGRVGKVSKELDGANLTENADRLIFTEINQDWLIRALQSSLIQDQIINATTKVGQPKLAIARIEKFLIALPPIEEQKRIIKKLDAVIPYIDKYNKIKSTIDTLNNKFPELLKKSILQEAVQGKLVPQVPSDEPASVLLERIRAEKERLIQEGKIKRDKHESVIYRRDNSHYEKRGAEDVCIDEEIPFEVPSSWALIRLNDIGIYKKGPFGSSLTKSMFVPKGTDTVKVYEQKNAIQKDHTLGTYYITHQYYESKMKSFTVEPGDILVSCAGTIGETYVLPEQIELGIINQALMRMTIYAPIDLDYFLLYFDYVLKQTAKESSKGSAIKNIPPFKIFKKLILPLPPLEEQKRIVAKVRELKKLCNLLCP